MNIVNERKSPTLTKNTPVVFHYRFRTKKGISGKGGVTIVYSPVTRRFGAALCSPKDNFWRQMGVKIATGRAAESTSAQSYDSYKIKTLDDARTHSNELAEMIVSSVIQNTKKLPEWFSPDNIVYSKRPVV